MPFNILLLPLLGGYYFISTNYYLKFKLQRLDRQRLLFDSILIGVILSTVSFTFISLIHFISPSFVSKVSSLNPINEPYWGTGVLAFILGIIFSHLSNFFSNKEKAIKKAIIKWGNELDILFLNALIDEDQLMITLTNGKVYIGFIVEISGPGKIEYYSLLPTLSGYRTTDKHKVKITTDYFNIFEKKDEYSASLTYINSQNILSVKKFIPQIFDEFNSQQK